jgi:hypothetical protein
MHWPDSLRRNRVCSLVSTEPMLRLEWPEPTRTWFGRARTAVMPSSDARGFEMAMGDGKAGTDWGKVAKWASRIGAVAGIVGIVASAKKKRKT